jgi:ATP-binding cassette subfamily F protein uup
MAYRERQEFERLERELEELNLEKRSIVSTMEDASLPYGELERLSARFREVESLIDAKEMRWLELSEYES